MADAANLFDLAATISVQTGQSDKALTDTQKKVLELAKQFETVDKTVVKTASVTKSSLASVTAATKATQQSTNKLSDAFHTLSSNVAIIEGPLGGVAGRISSLGAGVASISELGVAFGAVAGGVIAAGAALVGFTALVIKSANAFADYGGKVHDWQQKMEIGADSLATLRVISAETETDMNTLATTASRLQVSISKGISDPASEAGRALKLLNLDAKQLGNELPDAQLQKVAKALLGMENATTRARVASALAGRGFSELKPALNDISENWDEAASKAESFGLRLTASQIAAADTFQDTMADIGLATEGFLVQVGSRFVPQILGFMNDIEQSLFQNSSSWVTWAQRIGDTVAAMVVGLRVAFVAVKADLAGLAAFLATGNIMTGIRVAGATGSSADKQLSSDLLVEQMRRDVTGGVGRPRGGGSGFPGGGGGGGRGGGSAQIDRGVQLLKQLENQYKSLIPQTELQKVQEQLLGKEFEKTNDTIKKKIQITAMDIDAQKMISSITRERVVGLKAETEALEKMIEMIREAGNQGLPFFSRQRTTTDLTGLLGTAGTRRRSVADGATRPRIATVDRQIEQEKIEKFNERIHSLAADITSTIDGALRDGFESGIKAGIVSFAQGILEMIRSAALQALEKKLFDVFSKALGGGSSSGGGIWSKIIGIAGSVLGGAVGGGGGGGLAGMGGQWADGGFAPANSWNLVGEKGPELIRTGRQGATVIPNHALGGGEVHNHYHTWNISTPDARSFQSRETEAQVTRKFSKALQKRSLSG